MTDPLGPLPPEIARALAALPPPPPPPPVEGVLARLESRTSVGRPVALAIAAGVAVLFGAALALRALAPQAPDGAREPGDSVARSARVTWTEGAAVRAVAPDRLVLDSGAATFRVAHREGAPVRVRARDVEIVDVGTVFTVEVGAATDPTLVTVAEGAVEANGIRVPAGFGLGFTGAAAGGAPWRLDAKPAVSLELGDSPARAGAPVELRLVLSNPTDRRMSLPASDPLGAPVFVDVTAPSGAAAPVRVTPSMEVDPERLKAGIPPRGKTFLGLRFDTTFASKGTYRLRAVVQPAGTTEQPRSEELVLEVR
jgi:hypothetical protein